MSDIDHRHSSFASGAVRGSAFGRLTPIAILGAIAVAMGCTPPEPRDEDTAGEAEEALTTENPAGNAAPSTGPNTAEIIGGRYLVNPTNQHAAPDITFWSYATPSFIGNGACSATMIGPRIGMTAAHCGGGVTTSSVSFYRYLDGDKTAPSIETATCNWIQQAIDCDTGSGCAPGGWWGDVLLFECGKLPNGMYPGDKYGYLNFDRTPPTVGNTPSHYSLWWNPVSNVPNGGNALLYSEGWVTTTTGNAWCNDYAWNPCNGPGDAWQGVDMSMWGAPGASGSSHISFANHRIQIGPLSIAPQGNGGAYRRAESAWMLFNWAKSDPARNQVNTTYLGATYPALAPPPGQPWKYYNTIWDTNGDGVFDIQADLDRKYHGESPRDHYFLGFDSERRNALWDIDPARVQFDPLTYTGIHVDTAAASPGLARHQLLGLKPNTVYRMTLSVYVDSAGSSGAVTVWNAPGTVKYATINTGTVQSWVRQSFQFKTDASGGGISFAAAAAFRGWIVTPSLIEQGSFMDFDTFDKRFFWRNENNGDRAFILPTRDTNGKATWAGLVQRDRKVESGNDWPLRNKQLALAPDRPVAICFDVKQRDGIMPFTAKKWGMARLKDGSQSGNAALAVVTFNPSPTIGATPSWIKNICLPTATPFSGDNILQFGVMEQTSQQGAPAPSYYVDNIRITTN